MGGKTLNTKFGIKTERKSTSEHLEITKEISKIIKEMFDIEIFPLPFRNDKKDHGDLDILILEKSENKDIYQKLKKRFTFVVKNKHLYSFLYKNYQIDLIFQKPKNWETSKVYYSYDPCGNLIGKLFHKFGLKYGLNGLVYPVRNYSGRFVKDIIISKDNKKIFEFLGLDFERFKSGFNTIEEIFEFIISSKYFNSENFIFENLTNIDRKRNKKRNSYHLFLKYINEKDPNSFNNYKFDRNKKNYIEKINNYFPEANLLEEFEKIEEQNKIKKEVSEKFNGHIIKEYIKLSGKELGNFISKFKFEITDNRELNFDNYILSLSEEEIKTEILNYFNNEYKDYKRL